MSRTLDDDFEDDDLQGGSLDLEKGGARVGSGVASSYDGGGIDFDDELTGGDGPGLADLELDMPVDGTGTRPRPPPPAAASRPKPPAPAAPSSPGNAHGGPALPDLELDVSPSNRGLGGAPPPRSSATMAGDPAPARSSGALPAQPAPPSSVQGMAAAPPGATPPPGQGAHGDGAHVEGAEQPPAHEPPPPPAKPSAAAVIAKYPAPPSKIHQAPVYAVRVVLRQLELRADLESLRRRRSPDVPLYEAALKAYEPKTFRLGMAINGAAFAIATFIFFLPVIFRFMRD